MLYAPGTYLIFFKYDYSEQQIIPIPKKFNHKLISTINYHLFKKKVLK